jgi:L,D-transpeptidase ErfK/SrfK
MTDAISSALRLRLIAGGLLGVAMSACAARQPATGPTAAAPLPPLEKITRANIHISRAGELPPVIGHEQQYRIAPKDTLLDVARNAGLGFQEIKDANRDVDEWVPPPGRTVDVPTRWILPQAPQEGIVVNIPEMRLYYFPQRTRPGEAVTMRTWAIAIGDTDTPSPVGSFTVVSKDKNPTWIVPDSIYRTMDRPRRHVVPPGPDNPMGQYRIRLSKDIYSIHGTDIPWAIGRETTHGCIRLYPEDIPELYKLVKPSMRGRLVYQPIKLGKADGHLYVEVHEDVYKRVGNLERQAFQLVHAARLDKQIDPERLRAAVRERRGVPVDVTRNAT